ncbi:hypothetical protein AB0J83_34830 [Actinoplanes sp. NPDC049596]|uniref:hypothetical protein n=1 Tax=unclassified Actinoplanes TaxID=2626549 RepID=UPI003428E6F6
MENDAAVQLAAISDARSSLADRLVTPVWYHPALGLALAADVVAISLGNTGVKLAGGVLFVLAALWLANTYRQQTGILVTGPGTGRARRWAFAMGALIGAVLLTAWATGEYAEARWPIPVLAVIAFAGIVVLGRRYDAALRAQLRSAS